MIYDLHCHTKYSACSVLSPEIFLKIISKKADGVAITDHDTLKGYEKIKKINKNKDFDIISGVEKTTNFGHVLAYYVNKIPKSNDFFEVIDSLKSQGAIIAIAHPFSYIKKHSFDFAMAEINKIIKKIDAIECFNATMNKKQNFLARKMVYKYNTAKIGGSDSHFVSEIGKAYTLFEENLRKAIKTKKTYTTGKLEYHPLNQLASSFLSFFRKRDFKKS